MRGLGLINDRVQEDHAVYGIQPNARHVNLPYPGAGLEVGPARWPSARRVARAGFHDGLSVHEGVVRGTVPRTFAAAPGGGDHTIGVIVRYQACDAASCLDSSSVQLRVPVREAALIGRSLPNPTPKA